MVNIAVLVSGGGTNLQAILDAQARGEIKNGRVRAVISSNENAYALERARQAGVPGYVMKSLTSRTYPGPYVPPEKETTPEKDPVDTYNSLFSKARLVAPYTVTLKATQNSKGVANVRWAPSKKATLLKAYPSGTQVQVIAELDNWYQISDPSSGAVGFVNTAYVSK